MTAIAEQLSAETRTPIDPRPFEPRVIPFDWSLNTASGPMLRCWMNQRRCLTVLLSAAVERDGRRWLHVSASHHGRIPNWEELRDVKDIFIGRDQAAVQVLPREVEYINVNPRVLHLWRCLDGDVLPDFRVWNPFTGRVEI